MYGSNTRWTRWLRLPLMGGLLVSLQHRHPCSSSAQNRDEASASSLICHCPLPPSRAAESLDPLSLHPHGAISPLTPHPDCSTLPPTPCIWSTGTASSGICPPGLSLPPAGLRPDVSLTSFSAEQSTMSGTEHLPIYTCGMNE